MKTQLTLGIACSLIVSAAAALSACSSSSGNAAGGTGGSTANDSGTAAGGASAGGASGTGGSSSGGTSSGGGSSGGASAGGASGSGGATSTGGASGSGGATSTGGASGSGGAGSGGRCIQTVVGTCQVSIDGSGVISSCIEFSTDGSSSCAASNGIGTMKTTYVAGPSRCPTANLEGCCNAELTGSGSLAGGVIDTQTCFYPSHPNHGKQQQACAPAVNALGNGTLTWCPAP
jgi:hypothetical protein